MFTKLLAPLALCLLFFCPIGAAAAAEPTRPEACAAACNNDNLCMAWTVSENQCRLWPNAPPASENPVGFSVRAPAFMRRTAALAAAQSPAPAAAPAPINAAPRPARANVLDADHVLLGGPAEENDLRPSLGARS